MKASGMDPLIVIVDDNPMDQTLINLALEEGNFAFRAKAFEDGEEALRFLLDSEADERPQLLLLDLMLPKLDGAEIIARLRESERLAPVPVILVTALTPTAVEANLHGVDIQSFPSVCKPANGSEIDLFKKKLLELCESVAGLKSRKRSKAAEAPR